MKPTQNDLNLISKIVDRWQAMKVSHINKRKRRELLMDIYFTHNDVVPLDLQRLLDADDFNFAHDVFGIERHLNRDTIPVTMTGCFLPRFALTEEDRKARA